MLTLLAVGILISLRVYEPWRPTQFSVTDFCDFLPLLIGHHTFGGRLSAFVEYYSRQGRFNVVPYTYLILEWTAFGWNAAAWQVSRFVEMTGIVVLVYVLLRRLTGSRPGAGAGAALFFVASCASSAWIRLTLSEAQAMWPLLGAALLATTYQSTNRWRSSGLGIALLMIVLVLSKEVLIALVPFVVLLAWTYNAPGQFMRPVMSRRNRWIMYATLTTTVLASIPIALIALRASGSSYAGGYGHGSATLTRVLGLFAALAYPTYATYPPHIDFALPANFAFLLVIAAGWGLPPADLKHRATRRRLAACLVGILFVGVATYLPWPFFLSYYGLPYLLAPAALLAFAVKFIEQDRPRFRWLAYTACLVIVVQAAVYASYESRRDLAAREVNGVLIDLISQRTGQDTVLVATRSVSPDAPWGGTAQILHRFSAAVYPNRLVPPGFDVKCATARAVEAARALHRNMLVSFADQCGTVNQPSSVARAVFSYFYWPAPSIRQDSVRADVIIPAAMP